MTAPGRVDAAQVRRLIEQARTVVDLAQQLPMRAGPDSVDWARLRADAARARGDQLSTVVQRADAESFLSVIDGIIGTTVPLQDAPPDVAVDDVVGAINGLAQERSDFVRPLLGPDRRLQPQAYEQLRIVLRALGSDTGG